MSETNFDDYALLLHEDDDVVVTKKNLKAGIELANGSIRLKANSDIPAGHKVAIRNVAEGAPVKKYGQIIGFASREVSPGDHVHVHNLIVKDFGRDYDFCTDVREVNLVPEDGMRHFDGFLRPDGRIGTRNYVAVVSSVNCSASVSRYVVEHFRGDEFRKAYPNVDGVVAFTHKTGCGMPGGDAQRLLQRVLAGFARHPNVFGYILIGLGCEVNQIPVLVQNEKLKVLQKGELPPAAMTIQETGGVSKTVEAACEAVLELLPKANQATRSRQPLSKLMLAEECGGSDANSGITANPAVGVASDELVRYGATAVLGETPEIYGAEHLLTRRAVTQEVGQKIVDLIHWWEEYTARHGAEIDNNPSPGNKLGGLTTIYEKSLGAVAKAGQSPLSAVYNYAEQIETPGLGFMDTPGFDPVSMTGMVAGGCNVGVFTTGRGSVYGCKPAPCIKVATNTTLFERMEDDMDLNAGTILDGTETLQEVGMRLFEKIISVANGEKTKSELAGMGDEEFAPWQLWPTL